MRKRLSKNAVYARGTYPPNSLVHLVGLDEYAADRVSKGYDIAPRRMEELADAQEKGPFAVVKFPDGCIDLLDLMCLRDESIEEEALSALVEIVPKCMCGKIGVWSWSDGEGVEVRCDEHKDKHFYEYGPYPIGTDAARRAIVKYETFQEDGCAK